MCVLGSELGVTGQKRDIYVATDVSWRWNARVMVVFLTYLNIGMLDNPLGDCLWLCP